MDNLFETESETSDKEADNSKCAFCQKMYIDKTELIKHIELCGVQKNKDGENVSCSRCQEIFSNSKEILKHMEVH